MAGHSPLLYDRKYNPSAILSYREFIVCHRDFSNSDAARLCVWDPFRGMKTTLPPPPIFDTIFLCDGESVYVLSPATVTEKQNVPIDVYNVWMLDLREFNLRWKKLPSLPRLGQEYNIYASIRCQDWGKSTIFTLPFVWERDTYGSADELFPRRKIDGNYQEVEVEKMIASGFGNILT